MVTTTEFKEWVHKALGPRYRAKQAAERIIKAMDDKDTEIARLRKGLERLASCEAFYMSKVASEEERARMFYAEAILDGTEGDFKISEVLTYRTLKANDNG